MRKLFSLCAAMLVAFAVNAAAVVLPATLDVSNVGFRSEGMPDFVLEEGDYAGTYFDMGAHDSSNDTLLYAEWDVTIEPLKYDIDVVVYNENSWRVQLYLLNQAGDTLKGLRYKGSSGQKGQYAVGSLDLRDLEAGNYKLRAHAATAWSKMKLRDVIFKADYKGVPVAMPGTLLPAYAELSANASITNDAIAFKPSTAPDEYATWNVSFAKAGEYNVTIDMTATNGHNYGVALLSADGQTQIGAVNEGGQKSDTGVKELGAIAVPAAGSYKVKLTNATQWSEAVLNSITFASTEKDIYFKPGEWANEGAKFWVYAFQDAKPEYKSGFMTLAPMETAIYTTTIPVGYNNVVFVRMSGETAEPTWTGLWNQTEDMVIPEGKDMFTFTSWTGGADGKSAGTWSKYEYEEPAKFYITGSGDALGNWNPAAIKSTEDTYTLNLAAGSYRMKVTVDGTWATGKGIEDLTTRAAGLQDINGNIGFILEEAGQVQVTYTNSEFKLEGNFSNTPIYKTYMATGEGWQGDDESSAVWNNEAKTITVNLVKGKKAQWQAQVWYKDIVAKADKLYDINLKLTSTKALGGVIVKWQDTENIFIEEGISLEAGVAYSLSKLNQAGKAGGDGMLIFDFGNAAEGTVVTISEISIVEKDIPEPEPVVGCDWENLSWVGSALAPKYVNQFKVCVGENAPNIDVFQHPGWASEEGLYMTFPSAVWDKSKFSISADQYDLQGAGMIIHASVFELNYTEVTINCDNKDFTFTVYNANGPEAVYTVVGSSEVAFGTSWDLKNADNKMALEEGLYKWEKTELSLAAGEITFKVAKNHAWDEAWPASDYVLNIPSEGLYTISITFNESTKEVNATVTKTGEAVVLPTIKLHGNFDGEWKDTDPFVEAGDKKSASLTMTLDKGKYAFGLKKDGNWYANGSEFTRENPSAVIESNTNVDMSLDVDKDGAYTFTWTFETNTLDVDYPGCHWNELAWLGSTDATYANQFKVCVGDPTPNVVNIQKPGFASEIGIYLEFPSAVWDKSKFSLPESKYAIQGAGMVIYLSAFSAKETEVTIGCNNKDFIFTVYNAKGTDTPTSIDNNVVETKAVKYIQNGQLFIEMDGKVYNIVGARVK